MRVCLLQTDIAWNDADENERRVREMMFLHPGCDLYVLPEMWNTGFGITEPDEQAVQRMHRLANLQQAAVMGSVAVRTQEGSMRNRLVFARPDEDTITYYDKHHLFTYGGEQKTYEAGNERVVVSHCGVRILMQVCYDLRFPVFSRNVDDYDCVVYVASWPASRMHAWRTLLQARAIENQSYVLGVNRVGNDPVCSYAGGTAFVDPYGRATECAEGQSQALVCELDLDRLERFRKKFPVLADADRFTL